MDAMQKRKRITYLLEEIDEKIKTAVIWHKSTSKFKPDYSVDYLKDSPWIHMPFEKYETTNIKDFKFEK